MEGESQANPIWIYNVPSSMRGKTRHPESMYLFWRQEMEWNSRGQWRSERESGSELGFEWGNTPPFPIFGIFEKGKDAYGGKMGDE